MQARTSRHKRYSEVAGGVVTVYVTPRWARECAHDGKSAVYLRVTKDGHCIWAPEAPLCLSPLYDAESARGRKAAADAAVDFLDYDLGRSVTVAKNPGRRETLLDALAGVRIVVVDRNRRVVYAWFGGHGVRILDSDGLEVDFYNTGDFDNDEASPEEVVSSIERRMGAAGGDEEDAG